jgi:hypothetical protein
MLTYCQVCTACWNLLSIGTAPASVNAAFVLGKKSIVRTTSKFMSGRAIDWDYAVTVCRASQPDRFETLAALPPAHGQ